MEPNDTPAKNQPKNRRHVVRLATVAVAMLGFSYLLVPLYDIICDITGLNGRTGVVESVATATDANLPDANLPDADRMVDVEFIAHTTVDGQWLFEPERTSMQVRPGESYSMNYVAVNLQDREAVAQAVPSVAPVTAAPYFNKVVCFCFTSQAFSPGEERAMPVTFVVNSKLPKRVNSIALAYTFYDITDKSNEARS